MIDEDVHCQHESYKKLIINITGKKSCFTLLATLKNNKNFYTITQGVLRKVLQTLDYL